MQDFRKLQVWQEAHAMTLQIYPATRLFPRDELFGMTSQLRRAASSITLNICEGCGTSTAPAFARFLDMAVASTCEVEGALLLARDLGFMDKSIADELAETASRIRRMLHALIQRLREDPLSGC